MGPFLDRERLAEHRGRNRMQSLLLVGGMSLIVMVSAALIWSWPAAVMAVAIVVGLAVLGPRMPPEAVLRLYKAIPVDRRHGAQLLRIVEILADRAELRRHPRLYVIPSTTLNAFATGTKDNAVIAITEGLLRRLDLREVAAVIAHEMSHIRNNDLSVMAIADSLTRFTQFLAYFAVFMAVLNIPAMLLDWHTFPWPAILLLYFAPTLTSLLQMGLSRTREYDADLEAAGLTGDPAALASALASLERYQGRFWEDMMMPVPARRIPQPSLLRSHPETADRIARLRELEKRPSLARPLQYGNEPMFTMVGHGLGAMTPRLRPLGIWF
jgi:heat shock protein HtpX